MENQRSNGFSEESNDENYYTPKGRIGNDISLGVLGGIVYCYLAFIAMSHIELWLSSIIYFATALLFAFLKRHYISLGMALVLALPLLVFGGCLLLLGN